MPVQKRAISDGAKERRRAHIIDSAWALYKKNKGGTSTVNEIAAKAGLAKGTVYLYFKSKEEIYLAVFLQQIQLWVDSIAQNLNKLPSDSSRREIADALLAYIYDNPLLLNLTSLTYILLDNRTREQQLFESKVHMALMANEVGRAITHKWPLLSFEDSSRLALRIYALVIGHGQTLSQARRVNKKVAAMGLTLYDTDMMEFIRDSVEFLVSGALVRQ